MRSKPSGIFFILGITTIILSTLLFLVPLHAETAPVVSKKAPGGDIENSVFYIAVKENESAETKYYYFTMDELKAFETTEKFVYSNHYVVQTTIAKGALLKDLLDNLEGVRITEDMVIQYAEADAYHADAKTPVEESWYKDRVKWLTEPNYKGDVKFQPTRSIITYAHNNVFDIPDSHNVNDSDGLFSDVSLEDDGFLRIYREVGSGENDEYMSFANANVLRFVMGIVISNDGNLLSGEDGYTIQMHGSENYTIGNKEDKVVKGLLPGMQYAVSAPEIPNATTVSGQDAKIVTIKASVDEKISFEYEENIYFYIKDGPTKKEYTLTDITRQGVQIPNANKNEPNSPYGYEKPMYYRINGVWLSTLIEPIKDPGRIKKVEIISDDGSINEIAYDDLSRCFIAFSHTNSKTSLDTFEDERVLSEYPLARIIIPEEGVESRETNSVLNQGEKYFKILADAVVGLVISRY